jgi:nucleoside-diphosphate-sugar epimerase
VIAVLSSDMSIILVFGATGSVGQLLLPLLSPEHQVIAVSRSPNAQAGWICADLNDRDMAWPAADVAISLGPLDAFAAWLQRYPATTLQRVIALSSMSAQSKRESIDPLERALAERLRTAESSVMDAATQRGFACTLFRPTLIYGAGTDRSLAPIARFARRWRMLPIPIGARGLRQPVHARDLAAACAAILANASTFGKVYALGGGERLRFDTLLLRLRAALPGLILPLPVPMGVLRLAARWRRGSPSATAIARLREPLIADHGEAVRDFGYAPVAFIASDVLPPGKNI